MQVLFPNLVSLGLSGYFQNEKTTEKFTVVQIGDICNNVVSEVTRSGAYQISMAAESLKVACSPVKTYPRGLLTRWVLPIIRSV